MNLTKQTRNLVYRLRTCALWTRERGVVAMEFALTLPIWIALFFGTADTAHLIIMSQRVDRIAYSAADIITQQTSVTVADLNSICSATEELILPFAFGSQGKIIISSVFKQTGLDPTIVWQYTSSQCGTFSRVSQIGAVGDIPALSTLTLNDNDNVIISEVYYDYSPLFPGMGIFTAHDLYRATYFKPRLSPLTTPPT